MPEVLKPFATIREACNITGLSQHFLRDGVKAGTIPHIMSGNTYMINIPLLLQQLDNMSKNNMTVQCGSMHGGESVNRGENASKKENVRGRNLRSINLYETG